MMYKTCGTIAVWFVALMLAIPASAIADDDLDVTMEMVTDDDALRSFVGREVRLPERAAERASERGREASSRGRDTADERSKRGQEASEAARERGKEARSQRGERTELPSGSGSAPRPSQKSPERGNPDSR